jgi:hypothetical protein
LELPQRNPLILLTYSNLKYNKTIVKELNMHQATKLFRELLNEVVMGMSLQTSGYLVFARILPVHILG